MDAVAALLTRQRPDRRQLRGTSVCRVPASIAAIGQRERRGRGQNPCARLAVTSAGRFSSCWVHHRFIDLAPAEVYASLLDEGVSSVLDPHYVSRF